MSKSSKRSLATAPARRRVGRNGSPAAQRGPARRGPAPAASAEVGLLFEGEVLAVADVADGVTVRAKLAGGASIEASCPAHVDASWLRAACALAPVPAAFAVARPSGRHVLWGIFPRAAHAAARADLVIRGRAVTVDAESLALTSRAAHLRLEAEGDVALKGRDVTSHARRVNRIRGGSIRLN